MSLVLALLVAAGPPLEISVVGDRPVRLTVVHGDGGVAWEGRSTPGPASALFRATCLPGASLRVVVLDGGLASELPLGALPTDLSCEANVLAGDGAPLLFLTRRATPPAALTVQVLDAGDASGLGTLELANGTDHDLRVELDPPEPLDRGCRVAMRLPPHKTERVPLAAVLCPVALTPGRHQRVVRFEQSSWPRTTVFERAFEFTTPALPTTVLFPTVRFHRLQLDSSVPAGSWSVVGPNGARACACPGQLVGATPHVLVWTERGLCGRPVDAGIAHCESLVPFGERVGDFPELSPRLRSP